MVGMEIGLSPLFHDHGVEIRYRINRESRSRTALGIDRFRSIDSGTSGNFRFHGWPYPRVTDEPGNKKCQWEYPPLGVGVVPVGVGFGTTRQVPLTHPRWPAPQSMGPSQLAVQATLQTPLKALLMQLVGWQHWAGTQSEFTVQEA